MTPEMAIAHTRLKLVFAWLESLDIPDELMADIINSITLLIEAIPEAIDAA